MIRLDGENKNTVEYWNAVYSTPNVDDYWLKDSRYLLLANYVQNGDLVLDIGCADGGQCFIVKTIRPMASVIGIDFSPVAIEKAKRFYGHIGVFKVGSAEELEFADNTFDTIICGEAIEHLEEPERLIREVARVLKKGGRVLITCPYKETNELRVSIEHLWSFDGHDIKQMAERYFSEVYFLPWASGRRLIVSGTGEVLMPEGYLDILITLAIK